MTHEEHISLIEKGIGSGNVWADLGSGDGAFTLALRDIMGEDAKIYSVDKDNDLLERQKQSFAAMFPHSKITYLNQDFTEEMPLPLLDGILMANSLHYVRDQIGYLQLVKKYLKPYGMLLLVEYNDSVGNQYVPYAISFEEFKKLAVKVGFISPTFLHSIPSHFLNEIYAAAAYLK